MTRADVDRLAAAGLLAVFGAAGARRACRAGRSAGSPSCWPARARTRGSCGSSTGPVVKMLAASENTALAERHLGRAVRAASSSAASPGATCAPPRPSVFATRVDGGWSFSGFQPWCTGWGLIDVVLAGALDRGRRPRWSSAWCPPATARRCTAPGCSASPPWAARRRTRCASTACSLPDDDVVLRRRPRAVGGRRRGANTNVQPSTFGVALAALDALRRARARRRRRRCAAAAARRCARAAYRLLDEVHRQRAARRAARRAGRRRSCSAIECCTALLAARGGQGMGLADPAQRLLRAAAFQLVHSQAAHVRAATLDALVGVTRLLARQAGPDALVEEVVRGVPVRCYAVPPALGRRGARAGAARDSRTPCCSSTRRSTAP